MHLNEAKFWISLHVFEIYKSINLKIISQSPACTTVKKIKKMTECSIEMLMLCLHQWRTASLLHNYFKSYRCPRC